MIDRQTASERASETSSNCRLIRFSPGGGRAQLSAFFSQFRTLPEFVGIDCVFKGSFHRIKDPGSRTQYDTFRTPLHTERAYESETEINER